MIACFFLRITTIAVAIKTDDEICSKFAVKTNVYETKWSHDYIHWFQSINYKWCTYSKIFIWLCYLKFIDIYGSIFHLYWKFSTRFLLSLLKTRLHKWSNFQFYYHWQFPAVQPIKSWHYYFESFCHRSYWFYCRQKWCIQIELEISYSMNESVFHSFHDFQSGLILIFVCWI